MSEPTTEFPGQLAIDDAVGHRTVIDRQEATRLPAHDPNVAASDGDYNHEAFIGEETDDDHGVAEAGARIAAGGAL